MATTEKDTLPAYVFTTRAKVEAGIKPAAEAAEQRAAMKAAAVMVLAAAEAAASAAVSANEHAQEAVRHAIYIAGMDFHYVEAVKATSAATYLASLKALITLEEAKEAVEQYQ
jgi:hypothetical protein